MTPLQLARDYCANWLTDSKGCLGAIFDDDLQSPRCWPKPHCILESPGHRCLYFEECVVPMGRSIVNPACRQQFEAAVNQYRVAARLPTAQCRACPVCGRTMAAGRRFCFLCAAAKRKASTRKSAAKHRQACKQLSPLCPLTINDFQDQFGGTATEVAATLPAH